MKYFSIYSTLGLDELRNRNVPYIFLFDVKAFIQQKSKKKKQNKTKTPMDLHQNIYCELIVFIGLRVKVKLNRVYSLRYKLFICSK